MKTGKSSSDAGKVPVLMLVTARQPVAECGEQLVAKARSLAGPNPVWVEMRREVSGACEQEEFVIGGVPVMQTKYFDCEKRGIVYRSDVMFEDGAAVRGGGAA